MKIKKVYTLVLLSLALGATSVWAGGSWLRPTPGNGAWIREKIAVPGSPTILHFSGPIEVTLQPGPTFEAFLQVDENLVGEIKKEASAHTLSISVPAGVRPSKKVQINITLPELEEVAFEGAYVASLKNFRSEKPLKIQLSGSGLADLESLGVKTLVLEASGTGTTHLSGEASHLRLDLAGAVTLAADAFKTPQTDLQAVGSVQMSLGGSGQVKGQLTGSSSLRLKAGTAAGEVKTFGQSVVLYGQ
jgi:hypothetical protein